MYISMVFSEAVGFIKKLSFFYLKNKSRVEEEIFFLEIMGLDVVKVPRCPCNSHTPTDV